MLNGDQELLTTQFYLADYKFNASDGLYRRLTSEQADSVFMVFVVVGKVLETRVNVIL